jgi:hypothetical protein
MMAMNASDNVDIIKFTCVIDDPPEHGQFSFEGSLEEKSK